MSVVFLKIRRQKLSNWDCFLTFNFSFLLIISAPSLPLNLNSLFKPANGLDRPLVVITWGRPLHTNGIIRHYTIIYNYNNMNTSNKVIVEGTTHPLKHTVTVMRSGTFSYRIRASTIKPGHYAAGKQITIPEYSEYSRLVLFFKLNSNYEHRWWNKWMHAGN